ncbi:LacI family DNA-binding transcriptional regulator [Sandarakinorhabdus sp. DWP1-3-1]|uniref:LacI family DNA-binding transcriptional regulator n=1 Tax=Sandarakinorhabdus sp. DWP1-3-1 TaxID=2804627 RepID=UPI003CF5A133
MTRNSKQTSPRQLASAGVRPTSYDVALLAGVSQSAVSRCFRPGASIAAKTRAKVLAAARELDYSPNAMASGLITRRSNLVAVLISNLTNLYYPEVLAEITRRLSDRGIRVLLFALQAESDVDASLDQIWRYGVDGAIVAARLSQAQLHEFARHRVPVVLYNRLGDGEPVASVCCDSVGGERQLIDRLVAAGHREFGIISGPDDSYVSQERVRGAVTRLQDHGHSAHVVKGAFDYVSGESGLKALMAMTDGRIDALVCANDLMAIGAVDCARIGYGKAVPCDLSIVGFDGVAPAFWGNYRISTIRQPVRRMTEAAVTMVVERIEDPALLPEVRSFAGDFIEGASARLAPAR